MELKLNSHDLNIHFLSFKLYLMELKQRIEFELQARVLFKLYLMELKR